MGEQHLNAFAFTTRLFKGVAAGDRTSNVASLLVDVAEKLARWVLGATLHLQWTDIAIALTRPVRAHVVVPDPASRGQNLTGRTGVNVARLVIAEVLAREATIFPSLHVDDRDVRFDLFVIDEPIKSWRR